MTIGAILICVILSIIIIGIGIYIGYVIYDTSLESTRGIIGAMLTVVVSIAITICLWFGTNWYFTNTECGKRALKTQDSELNGGITRQVLVYDMDGDLITSYTGKFDIEYSDERIMFDDENGDRHIIYFKSETVIVDEVSGKNGKDTTEMS